MLFTWLAKVGGEEVGGCGGGGEALGGQLHQLGHLLGHHLSAIGKTKKFIENIILKHIILNTAKTGRIF